MEIVKANFYGRIKTMGEAKDRDWRRIIQDDPEVKTRRKQLLEQEEEEYLHTMREVRAGWRFLGIGSGTKDGNIIYWEIEGKTYMETVGKDKEPRFQVVEEIE